MAIDRFKALENQTHILKELADTFLRDTPQYAALENASFALIFAISEQYESFIRFIESNQEELSDEQKINLQKLGISI